MFDSLKGMAGLAGIMKDLPKLKAQMDEVKARLETMTTDAETGGGAVRVTASGTLKIVSLKIDPVMMSGLIDANDPADRAMAEELISGAVNAALEKAREMAQAELAQAAGDLGIPLPAGGLGDLMT